MTRVHDMGGRHGDGPVVPEAEGRPVFDQDWHGRALALTLAAGALGQWNLDISRHARERLSPKDYTQFSYYEKWISALADLLVERGVLSRDELKTLVPDGPSDLADKKMLADSVAGILASGGPVDRNGPAPRFEVGDKVRTRLPAENQFVAGGHTRLPGYAAGHMGRILSCHGCHVFPDAHAHGLGEDPRPIYAVSFAAKELWGDHAKEGDEVILDLWEPYLEPCNG